VTETDAVAHAIDLAARRWPGEPRSKLLLRLVSAGGTTLEHEEQDEEGARRDAILSSSGKYGDAFTPDHLNELREDWPA
jgi:hypothetical protein